MKNLFVIIFVAILSISCSSEKKKTGNMLVNGQIKGLRKGKIYLQKMKDTVLVSVDSVNLSGNDTFVLSDQIENPEMYFLTFDGNTTQKSILFFGEKGIITINDELEKFGINPEISGSKNQEILERYKKTNNRFKNQRLDLIKKSFDAQKDGDTELLKKIEETSQKMIRRRYLYTTNFALSNANSEVAPYLALTELYNANIKLLDTIYTSMSDNVRKSKYGKRLENFILKIKKETNSK